MRSETAGWLIAAISFYAFHALMILVGSGVIQYSRYDLVLGITLGFFVVVALGALLAGVAIMSHEAAARQNQPWL